MIAREFAVDRPSHTCKAGDDADWTAFLRVLQRDLRGQVFLRQAPAGWSALRHPGCMGP
jgi:hypothetical protein